MPPPADDVGGRGKDDDPLIMNGDILPMPRPVDIEDYDANASDGEGGHQLMMQAAGRGATNPGGVGGEGRHHAQPEAVKSLTKVKQGMIIRKWRVTSRIGAGSFGETFVGVLIGTTPAGTLGSGSGRAVYEESPDEGDEDGTEPHRASSSGEEPREVCIKVEQESKNVLRLEVLALKKVQSCPQVVRYIASGRFMDANYLVMERLGPNLVELRRMSSRGIFSIYTMLKVGVSCLRAIKGVHELGLIHRDIKPSNFVVGTTGAAIRECYLIDFGLARRFRRSNGEVRPARDDAGFRGTSRYASLRSHQHQDLGRVDDLWSLLFMLIEFATGTLPWRKYKEKEDIGRCKEETVGPQLVKNLPREFAAFLEHLQNCSYASEPKYDYLISLLHHAIERRGYPEGKTLDWEEALLKQLEEEEEKRVTQRLHELDPVDEPNNPSAQGAQEISKKLTTTHTVGGVEAAQGSGPLAGVAPLPPPADVGKSQQKNGTSPKESLQGYQIAQVFTAPGGIGGSSMCIGDTLVMKSYVGGDSARAGSPRPPSLFLHNPTDDEVRHTLLHNGSPTGNNLSRYKGSVSALQLDQVDMQITPRQRCDDVLEVHTPRNESQQGMALLAAGGERRSWGNSHSFPVVVSCEPQPPLPPVPGDVDGDEKHTNNNNKKTDERTHLDSPRGRDERAELMNGYNTREGYGEPTATSWVKHGLRAPIDDTEGGTSSHVFSPRDRHDIEGTQPRCTTPLPLAAVMTAALKSAPSNAGNANSNAPAFVNPKPPTALEAHNISDDDFHQVVAGDAPHSRVKGASNMNDSKGAGAARDHGHKVSDQRSKREEEGKDKEEAACSCCLM